MKLDRSWTHKREHQSLSIQLVESSGSGFRAAVLPLLRAAFHETALAWHPASLPELGEDHIVWWSGEEIALVTASLAFSGPELGEDEIRRVREVIRWFAGSTVRTAHYLLVHNCESRRREAREGIAAELQALTSAGRVNRAEAWDRQRLLGEAFNGMLRHTWAALQVSNLSTAPLEALKSQAAFGPLEEVPCELSLLRFNQYQLRETVPEAQALLDPAAVMLDPKGELLTLITGEFGLGKTTAVARAVARETRPVLYVAGARISKETVSKKDFLQQCIDREKLFWGFPLEDHPTLEKLARPVIEYLLQDGESQTLVVIDGLDESAFLARRGGGFQQLFNILQEVRSPIVLTLRTEFWDRGVEGFAAALGTTAGHGERRNRKIRRIDLLPWGDDSIQALIRRYREGASDPSGEARLEELAELVDGGNLSRLYGDIPRRPLFLRFLLDTVLEDGLPAAGTGRARLLHDWAHRKLYRDIQAPVAAGGPGRLPILSEDETAARAVEIAWEAMLEAAAAMVEPVEGTLELAADCTLDKVRGASSELSRIEEPLGVFLNSLLLSAGPVPRGFPLRIRFAHRAFQEFFLAWFALIHPDRLPAGSLPDPVREWMTQIQAEGLLPASASTVETSPRQRPEPAEARPSQLMTRINVPPPDLEIRVKTTTNHGQTRLSYILHSSAGVAPFTHHEIPGPILQGSPEALHLQLLQQIEDLGSGFDPGGALVLSAEVEHKLIGIGRDLWRQLFTEEMRQAYRRFRSSVRSLLIISDEPWIPWEMVKPYDDEGELLNDPFFAEHFELTRWLAGKRALPGDISIHALACVTGPGHLPLAAQERDLVIDLTRSRPGLRDATPEEPGVSALTALLEQGGVGLLHFALHGTFDPSMPNEAGLPLADDSVFRPSDLHGPVQTQISKDRPLIVLNACGSGRQGWTWTGLGGWADRWVRVCGCGAFIGPLWQVRDSAAFAFTSGLYDALSRGETLGRATQEARIAAREAAPGNPSWLAYTAYGHPNAQVRFGTSEQLPLVPARVPEKASDGAPSRRARPSARVPQGRRKQLRWIWATTALVLAMGIHFAANPILDFLFPLIQEPPRHLPDRKSSDPPAVSAEAPKIGDQASEASGELGSNPRSSSETLGTNQGDSVDRHSREDASSNTTKAPESFAGQHSDDLVRLTVHPGHFARNPNEPLYFLNLTNLSKDVIEITHVWFQCPDSSCQILVRPWSRPLPKRLQVNEAWSTWVAVSKLPPAERSNAFDNFQIRLSTGEVFKSRKEESILPQGPVPGGQIDDRDFPPVRPSDETSVTDFGQHAEETEPPRR